MQYKQLITSNHLEVEQLINDAAKEGWKLLCVTPFNGSLLMYLQK